MAEDDYWRQMIAPFSPRVPGLAPAERQALPAREIDRTLRKLRPARIETSVSPRPPHPEGPDRRGHQVQALHARASGFLLKDSPPDQLLAATRIVAGGDALL